MEVGILSSLTTFTQLTARLENFLRGWLLILGLKEGLVECATVCVKSEVMLTFLNACSRSSPKQFHEKTEFCKVYSPSMSSRTIKSTIYKDKKVWLFLRRRKAFCMKQI